MRDKIPSVPRRKHPPHPPQVKPHSSKHSCPIARWFDNFLRNRSMKQLGGNHLYHRSWNLNLTGICLQAIQLQCQIHRAFIVKLGISKLVFSVIFWSQLVGPETRRRLKMPARRRERVMVRLSCDIPSQQVTNVL